MRDGRVLQLALVAAVLNSGLLFAQTSFPEKEADSDRQDRREDRRELRDDRRALYRDRRDLRGDRQAFRGGPPHRMGRHP